MKCYSSNICSRIAVCFLLSIQITATVCLVERGNQTIVIKYLFSLPEIFFENDSDDLTTINITWNIFATLPEHIFENQTKLQTLALNWNSLTTLPENILKSQTKLRTLHLGFNRLTTLPENIFKSQSNLETLYLNGNGLTTLPENLFKSQIKLKHLELQRNYLEMLPKSTLTDILNNSNLNELKLSENPWLCDCDFLERIRPHINKFQLGELVCIDGERVADKIEYDKDCPHSTMRGFDQNTQN